MWKYLTIQGLLFFLFFQPNFVGVRAARYFLLLVALSVVALTYIYAELDPFVWVLYCISIVLTYLTARKALRWVTINRQNARDELIRIESQADGVSQIIDEKTRKLKELQSEINSVSHIYDKVKQMSRSLDILDVFVDFSEAVMESFYMSKARLLILKKIKNDNESSVERVYQLDRKYLQFSAEDKAVIDKDVMFRGEIYPIDVRLVHHVSKSLKPFIYWATDEDAGPSLKLVPSPNSSFVALPVVIDDSVDAVLTLENVRHDDFTGVQILTDRFMSEFNRIKLYEDVQRLAITDWLTGAYVRRYFFKRLEEEIARSSRFNLKFSFLMIDLDDFKKLNDTHGHMVGDAVLRQTADMIRETLREVDLVGRYGGEEFAVILLDTDEKAAMYAAERIRKSIETHSFKVYDLDLSVTASIGLATHSPEIRETGEIVEWADSALYRAKRQGKNMVCAYIDR